MSRIGKMPINIPEGVKVEVVDDRIVVTGKLGTLTRTHNKNITIKEENNQILVSRNSDEKEDRAMHGLYRALINNMIKGVSEGYKKTLVIAGVGYRATVQGNKLVMSLGFSHPVEVVAPEGIKFETKDANTIVVSGIDNELVGKVASKIRDLRPVEPYHLYGIHYDYEHLTKKEGKKAAAGGKK
jgi:large subunit ribosomal protein L6